MSRRSPSSPSTPAGGSGSVGARAFKRQARAADRYAPRRRGSAGRRPNRVLLSLRERLRSVPRAAWICAAIACMNAAAWSIVNPPFQVPDEPAHFAYVQQLAENRALPNSSERSFSPEEEAVLRDLHQYAVQGSPEARTISTSAEQQRLQEDLSAGLSRRGGGGVEGAHASPPLYYLVQLIPYGLASGGSLLDQLELMRLLSALMAGLTTIFVFLFVRETLPSFPWTWTVAATATALAPLLGFISGAVNPDAMLVPVCAATFYCLAYAFRHGLTRGLAAMLGALMAVGFLTKLNFIGLAPGVAAGLVVLSVRAAREYGHAAYLWLALALGIAISPLALYILVNLASGHPALGIVSSSLEMDSAHGPPLVKLSYVWQLYLPPLPGMTHYFPGLFTPLRLWFDRWVGFYGWLDTSFPLWVDQLALLPAAAILALAIRGFVLSRASLRRCAAELAVYATMGLGLLVLIGLSQFLDSEREGLGFGEPRYLLPLLPLLGAVLVLAARGAGRRWGPVAGAAIVVVFLAHDVLSQLLVIGRFYG